MLKKRLRKGPGFSASFDPAPPGESWEFTYIGYSGQRETPPTDDDQGNTEVAIPGSSAFPLCLAQPGDRLQVSALEGDRQAIRQLQQLGIHHGAVICVISRQASGSLVVQTGSTQLGLSATLTPWIAVNSA